MLKKKIKYKRESQLSEILTEPLNPRSLYIPFYNFKFRISSILPPKKAKYMFDIYSYESIKEEA